MRIIRLNCLNFDIVLMSRTPAISVLKTDQVRSIIQLGLKLVQLCKLAIKRAPFNFNVLHLDFPTDTPVACVPIQRPNSVNNFLESQLN